MTYKFEIVTENVSFSDKAQWVVMPDAARQQWAMYRAHFTVKSGEKTLLLISAAEYCVVYINGTLISRCFLRSYIYDKAYEVYDISSAVLNGDNTVAVYACESGEAERCGFVCEIKNGDEVPPLTWVCRADDSVSAPCAYVVGPAACEIVDMSKAICNWQGKDYDDSDWQNVKILGGIGRFPFEKMHQSKKEPQTSTLVTPEKTVQIDAIISNNSKSFHLSSAPKCDSVFYTEINSKSASHIRVRTSGGINGMCLDGVKISIGEYINLSAGKHIFGILSLGGAPELTVDFDCEITFGGWRVYSVAQPRMPFAYPWNEPRRARILPDEINKCLASPLDFADASQPATIGTPDLYHKLTTAEYTEKAPVISDEITLSCGQRATYFFGTERIGLISVDFTAPVGSHLAVITYEMDINGKIRYMSRYSMTEIVSRGGRQKWTSVRRRGFRYVAVYSADGDITVHSVTAYETRCNAEPAGSFRCDDDRINDIYDMCVRTAQVCMMDMYVDCPGYEQNPWVGDAGITALVNMVNFGKGAFDGEYLRTIGLSMDDGLERFYRTGNPRYVARKYLPCACFPTYPEGGIPIWSYTYILQTLNHYLYFGADGYTDTFVADIDLALRRSIELTDDRGLLSIDGAWNLIEWADNDLDMCGEVTANNCMLSACFARASDFVRSLGMKERADEYAAYAAKYRDAVNKYCYDEKVGAYVDTVRDEYAYSHYLDVYAQKGRTPLLYDEYLAHARISVQTNTFAVLFDCADGKRRENALKILENAVENGVFFSGTPSNTTADASAYGADKAVTIGTPFFLYYALDCLIKCGKYDIAMKSIKRDWSTFINDGFNTCVENFHSRSGEIARSVAHAWGSSPAIFLMRDVLGIRPTKPGYAEFTVEPHLGNLAFAQGSVPTPHGIITVNCRRTGGKTEIEVTSPDGCKYVK